MRLSGGVWFSWPCEQPGFPGGWWWPGRPRGWRGWLLRRRCRWHSRRRWSWVAGFGELPLGIEQVVGHVERTIDDVGQGSFPAPMAAKRAHQDVDVVVPRAGGGAQFFVS